MGLGGMEIVVILGVLFLLFGAPLLVFGLGWFLGTYTERNRSGDAGPQKGATDAATPAPRPDPGEDVRPDE